MNAPKLAIGDGALGFWAALDEIYPGTAQQRCWVHKTANVLNHLPKSAQPKAKQRLQDIRMAATRDDALKVFDLFIRSYEDKYLKTAQCLLRDQHSLLNFYDYPSQHWQNIHTTIPIESTFATIRHRTQTIQGLSVTRHDNAYDGQAGSVCRKTLAQTSRLRILGKSHH